MKILFKYPTFGRKDWFFDTLDKYYSMISNKTDFKFVITMNTNDGSMNNDEVKARLDKYPNLEYFYGNHDGKIAAVNADMQGQEFDILFLVSDDMIPQVKGFDDRIRKDMSDNFPNLDGALHYKDGFQSGVDKYISLSIMGKKMYDTFGYIYHPAYKSIWCDIEFTDVVKQQGKYKYFPDVIVRHDWCGKGQGDATHIMNSMQQGNDAAVYRERKHKGFSRD